MSFFLKIRPDHSRFLLYIEGVLLASCVSLIVVETLQHRCLPVQHLLVLAGFGLMGLMLVNVMLIEYKRQQHLTVAYELLRQSSQQVEDLTAVQERNRITRDIHDALGHTLTTLNIQLQTTVKLWQKDPEQAQMFLVQAQRLGEIAIKDVRHSVKVLCKDAREDPPIKVVIESLVEDFRQGNCSSEPRKTELA